MNLYFAVIIYFSAVKILAIFSRQRYNYDNVFCVVFSVRYTRARRRTLRQGKACLIWLVSFRFRYRKYYRSSGGGCGIMNHES